MVCIIKVSRVIKFPMSIYKKLWIEPQPARKGWDPVAKGFNGVVLETAVDAINNGRIYAT